MVVVVAIVFQTALLTLVETAVSAPHGTTENACQPVSPACSARGSCGADIVSAMTACSNAGGGVVQLTPGIYHMNDSSTGGAPMIPAVSLQSISNVTLLGESTDGLSTLILLHDQRKGFSINDCVNISFKNIAVDTARPMFTYGKVTQVNQNDFTVAFDPTVYPFPKGSNGFVPSWLLKVLAVFEFDDAAWRPPHNPVDHYATSDPFNASLVGLNEYKVQASVAGVIDGMSLILRHEVYGGDAFNAENVSGLVYDNVVLWGSGGMGFYCGNSNDIVLIQSAVRRRPGLPMSITADASHFNQCSGAVILDRVHFEGQGDDGMNVHGTFHDVRKVETVRKLTESGSTLINMTLGSRPAGGTSILDLGGVYEFRNRSTWMKEGTGSLLEFTTVPGSSNLQTATFEFPAGSSPNVSVYAMLTDISRQPSVHVRGSFFGLNRARGNLIKTSNVLVEDSQYGPTTGPCIQANPDGCYWFESNGFTNWTVRNVSLSGCAGMDIFVAACAPKWSSSNTPLASGGPIAIGQPFGDIQIQNSRFYQEDPHPAVAIWGSDGLTVTNNVIILNDTTQQSKLKSLPPLMGSFDGFDVARGSPTRISGWVVDPSLGANVSSNVSVTVNSVVVLTAIANSPRPDLVPVVTKYMYRGIDLELNSTWSEQLLSGNHTLGVLAHRADGSMEQLKGGPMCVTPFRRSCHFPSDCHCGAPVPSALQLSNSLRCNVGGNTCYGKPCGSVNCTQMVKPFNAIDLF